VHRHRKGSNPSVILFYSILYPRLRVFNPGLHIVSSHCIYRASCSGHLLLTNLWTISCILTYYVQLHSVSVFINRIIREVHTSNDCSHSALCCKIAVSDTTTFENVKDWGKSMTTICVGKNTRKCIQYFLTLVLFTFSTCCILRCLVCIVVVVLCVLL